MTAFLLPFVLLVSQPSSRPWLRPILGLWENRQVSKHRLVAIQQMEFSANGDLRIQIHVQPRHGESEPDSTNRGTFELKEHRLFAYYHDDPDRKPLILRIRWKDRDHITLRSPQEHTPRLYKRVDPKTALWLRSP